MLVDELRLHTRSLHDEIEKSAPFRYLLTDTLSSEQYASALNRLLKWYALLEKPTYAAMREILADNTPTHLMSGFIEQDLACLNMPAQLPQSKQNGMLGLTSGQAVGVYYVMLGSSLGSRHILKHIAKLNRDRAGSMPTHHFAQNAARSESWSSFIQLINQRIDPFTETGQDAIYGAVMAFDMLLHTEQYE